VSTGADHGPPFDPAGPDRPEPPTYPQDVEAYPRDVQAYPDEPEDRAGATPEPAPTGDGVGSAGDAGEDGEDGPVPEEVTRLAAAVVVLDGLADLPVAEHVARYEALHAELADALASIDEV
jgi:hypothetical protein